MGTKFASTVPVEYMVSERGADRGAAIARMKERMQCVWTKLAHERPVLVGHNFLYDLCFIYQSFCGPLPDTIDEFGQELCLLFPRLVDTKYLARRHGDHSMLADDTLTELFDGVKDINMPRIVADPSMPEVVRGDYPPAVSAHQAGYDSKFLPNPPLMLPSDLPPQFASSHKICLPFNRSSHDWPF